MRKLLRGERGSRTKWVLVLGTVVLAFVTAGQLVSRTADEAKNKVEVNEVDIETNRATLVTVCSALGTLGIVFEQLQIQDTRISRNPTLSLSVRRQVTQRAMLYGAAVHALAQSDQECEQLQ